MMSGPEKIAGRHFGQLNCDKADNTLSGLQGLYESISAEKIWNLAGNHLY